MKKILSKLLGGVLLFSLSMSLTSCDPYLDDILGEWSRPTPGSSTGGAVAVTSIDLDADEMKLTVGDKGQLTAKVDPAGTAVTWSSDKEEIATVDANGMVTAVAVGTAIITAKAGDKTAECTVTVTLAYPIALSAVTADYLGSVVCSDGNVYPAKTAAPSGKTAVGILGKVTTTGHGLILALKDAATNQKLSTINGWTSVTYAGTTLKLLTVSARSPLTSYTMLGSTAVSDWCVAQKSDYEDIFINLGSTTGDTDGKTYDANVNAYITTGVGGTAISDVYWSATKIDDSYGWIFGSNGWLWGTKGTDRFLRPVLGF